MRAIRPERVQHEDEEVVGLEAREEVRKAHGVVDDATVLLGHEEGAPVARAGERHGLGARDDGHDPAQPRACAARRGHPRLGQRGGREGLERGVNARKMQRLLEVLDHHRPSRSDVVGEAVHALQARWFVREVGAGDPGRNLPQRVGEGRRCVVERDEHEPVRGVDAHRREVADRSAGAAVELELEVVVGACEARSRPFLGRGEIEERGPAMRAYRMKRAELSVQGARDEHAGAGEGSAQPGAGGREVLDAADAAPAWRAVIGASRHHAPDSGSRQRSTPGVDSW